MAKKFLTHIDLVGNQLIRASLEKLASDPTTNLFEGRIYYNTTSSAIKIYDGNAWAGIGEIVSIVGTENEIEVSVVDGVATVGLPSTIYADVVGNLTGNADTATTLATSRTIELTGDVTGSASFDGSANASITATIAANSVELGTDTTGDYVASVSASDGISATGTGEGASVSLTNTDKGSDQNIFKNISDGTTSIVADNNDDTVTFSAGNGISVSANATTDTMTISNTGVLSVSGTADQITASTESGAVTISLPNAVTFPGTVTLNADPTQALQAATKQYVDAVAAEGLHVQEGVDAATTATLAVISGGTVTYNNGTSGVGATLTTTGSFAVIDGVTLDVNPTMDPDAGGRVLVKNESNKAHNGIYYLTSTTVLTRDPLFDSDPEIEGGDFVFVVTGDTLAGTGWVQTNTVNVVGTDEVIWQQFSGAGTYVAGNGLTLTGTSFAIDTDVVVDVNSEQTLSNKTLTSPVVSGLYLSDNNVVVEGTDDVHETTLVFTDPTQDNTITFKNASGTVAFTADITSAVDALTTSDIEEGTNLYYTDERAQDAVGGIVSGSNSLAVAYNDGTPSITFDTTLATTSYMSKDSGLAVDIVAVETKLVTDGFTKKVAANVGNGTNTSFAIAHNLGSRDVVVNVYDNGTYETVEVDVVRTDSNTVTVSFTVAPTSNAYRVVVIG